MSRGIEVFVNTDRWTISKLDHRPIYHHNLSSPATLSMYCAETNSAPGRQIKTVVDSAELYAQQIAPFANGLSKFYLKRSVLVSFWSSNNSYRPAWIQNKSPMICRKNVYKPIQPVPCRPRCHMSKSTTKGAKASADRFSKVENSLVSCPCLLRWAHSQVLCSSRTVGKNRKSVIVKPGKNWVF